MLIEKLDEKKLKVEFFWHFLKCPALDGTWGAGQNPGELAPRFMRDFAGFLLHGTDKVNFLFRVSGMKLFEVRFMFLGI